MTLLRKIKAHFLAKNTLIFISSLVLGCSGQVTFAKNTPQSIGSGNFASEINNIVHSVDSNATVGVKIKSMKSGETMFSRNENNSLVPASILKVVTAQAALSYLGPQYKFKTTLATDAKSIHDGIVEGNIYLIHSGDPTLTYNDLTDLMDTLKSQKIQKITGNVYIDNSAYDSVVYNPGWIWNDKRFCYAAPISASIINHNCLSFRMLPGKTGQLANVVGSPNYYYSSIQNSVITKQASKSCFIRLTNNADSSISVSGCMRKGTYAQGVSTVISEVVEYNKAMMRDLFKRAGIQIYGNVSSKTSPGRLQLMATHESQPLSQLITEMLKKSDNIIAGSLFKKIGAVYSRQPGSWENGSRAVTQILAQKLGLNTANLSVLDGSGLSRYNQISPSQMMQILDYAYHNESTNYDFVSALPIAGIDGTLKHRLYNIAWKVRAKTGTMSGVVALAGYAITKNKEPIAFVIMINGHTGLGWKYKGMEDRIVTAVTNFSRT